MGPEQGAGQEPHWREGLPRELAGLECHGDDRGHDVDKTVMQLCAVQGDVQHERQGAQPGVQGDTTHCRKGQFHALRKNPEEKAPGGQPKRVPQSRGANIKRTMVLGS